MPNIYFKLLLLKISYYHKKELKRIRKQKKIKVAFFLIHDSIWKYEGVYKLMLEDERFEPIVVVCPYISYDEEVMFSTMNQAYNSFKEKGYNVIKTYNEDTREWLDVKKDINPDIIFFTNPHRITKWEYYIYNFKEYLTCYVPYFYVSNNLEQSNYNLKFHNLLWLAFYESYIHKEYAIKIARNKGKNVIITGYPAIDLYFEKCKKKSNNIWKSQSKKKKRIIWAPHHTIKENGGELNYSCFEKHAEIFLEFAIEFENEIQFSFKPHPILKSKLLKSKNWGEKRTNDYYSYWNKYDNCQLNEGEYIELFINSDALIHDSASFMTEYLATGKPLLYTLNDKEVSSRMNSYGQMALSNHYVAQNKNEIRGFIIDVVLNGQDTMYKDRQIFIEKYLRPPNNKSASLNIYEEIKLRINDN